VTDKSKDGRTDENPMKAITLCMLHLAGLCEVVHVHPTSSNATYGTNITLHCVADSEESKQWGVLWETVKSDTNLPTTICSWADDPLLRREAKYLCTSDENNHTLFIHNLHFNDSGKYVCIEDGGRGPGKGYFELSVIRK